jgi:hypothetical protein
MQEHRNHLSGVGANMGQGQQVMSRPAHARSATTRSPRNPSRNHRVVEARRVANGGSYRTDDAGRRRGLGLLRPEKHVVGGIGLGAQIAALFAAAFQDTTDSVDALHRRYVHQSTFIDGLGYDQL